MSGTLLAFDFGTKSIGVAVGQRITGTARPLPAIKAQGLGQSGPGLFLHCAAVDSFHGYRSANAGEQFTRR